MANNKEKLFDMFAPVSKEEWKAKAIVDLKGADFDKKLVWRTNEGFNVEPMYRLEDIKDLPSTTSLPGEYPFVRGFTADNNVWLVRQDIVVTDAAAANAKALDVLNKGITSLGFVIKTDLGKEGLATLLRDVYLPAVELNFVCCPKCVVELTTNLVAMVKESKAEETFCGSVDFNPFKRQLRHDVPFEGDVKAIACELMEAAKDVKGLRLFGVNTNVLCNAGSYICQELGYALAWGAEWMTLLTDAGYDAVEAGRRIKFNMGVSTNFFMEVAKFRAARMLWAQIVKQYNPCCECACKMIVNAVTSEFNQTVFDAHVNLLRSQTETMSAAIGGVHSISVTPFDKQYKTPDDFSERLARNQQIMLQEESHFDKVVDAAGGSYYVETLTASVANKAWEKFLKVEELGGFAAALAQGEVQKDVNASAAARLVDVSRRKEVLLGSNQYPNFTELAASKIENEGCCCSCGCNVENGANALNTRRAASEFEDLRLATERSGKRPKVFMLTIGNLAMRLARSQFSSNFFGCAGYELIDNLGFNTVQEGVDAALAKGADVVVLCSSDDEYETLAPEAFNYLNGRAEFVVAGNPACTDALKEAGIQNFIHVRSNVLDTLRAFNAKLLK